MAWAASLNLGDLAKAVLPADGGVGTISRSHGAAGLTVNKAASLW